MSPRDGWPRYSDACKKALQALVVNGRSLTAYRSNPTQPYGPAGHSWAWRFERLAERTAKVQHVILCSSGTMALIAALRAVNLRAKDRVITSPFTFSATPAAIKLAGYKPVFADVGWSPAGCLDPVAAAGVDGALTVPVDLFGAIAARTANRPIVADSCQAVGAYHGMRGAKLAVWSMNGQKNIPAGEAGAVLTDDTDLALQVRQFISHGENWMHTFVGLNGRVNELTACVAYHGLQDLPEHNKHRQMLALALRTHLKGESRVIPLTPEDLTHHALYVYPLLVAPGVDRGAFVRGLQQLGIEAGEGYIRPHLGKYPAFLECVEGPLPVVEELSESRLVLLYHIRPPASRAQMRWVARAIRLALDGHQTWRGPRPRMASVEPGAF